MTTMAANAPDTLGWQNLRAEGDCGVFVRRVRHQGEIGDHDHLFHEIVVVEGGTAEHMAVDGGRKLRPGDVIVIRPQVWHAYRRPRDLTIINCLIDSRLMNRLVTLLTGVRGAFELFRRREVRPWERPPTVLHASPAGRSAIGQRLELMMAEQREKRNGWEAVMTAGALDVLVAVTRLGDEAGSAMLSGSATDRAVAETAGYLEGRMAEPVSLDDLAARVGMSPAHLCRSFGKRMGMGIVEFVHQIRAEEACRLLRCTDLPITAVAARVGYNEVAYFSRRFRGQIGKSPREYRRGWHHRAGA